MSGIEGGCLCGQVRYRMDGPPVFQAVCHCTDCQKQSGTAFSVVVGTPATALTVEGRTKRHTVKGDSGGEVHRDFCPECGSPIASYPGDGAVAVIKGGTLDDTSILNPKLHIWCSSAQNWQNIPGDVTRFEKNFGG